jgi:hypothetical protein
MRVGDVFAVPLRVGGFGAAVVIEASGGFIFLVIDGFWNARPAAEDLGEPSLMPLPFGQRPLPGREGVFKGWFDGDVPSDFELVLNRPLTASEKMMRGAEGTMVFQNARHFARTLSDQWRFLNDHAAYRQEIERKAAAFEKSREQRRANLSLETMASETFFAGWSGRWPEEQLARARRIFTDATAKLSALQARGTPRKRSAVFLKIVEEFNRLDNETGLVESVERDAIVERIDELAALVGLDNASEKLTRRRTW